MNSENCVIERVSLLLGSKRIIKMDTDTLVSVSHQSKKKKNHQSTSLYKLCNPAVFPLMYYFHLFRYKNINASSVSLIMSLLSDYFCIFS